jgi:hypothetical protein
LVGLLLGFLTHEEEGVFGLKRAKIKSKAVNYGVNLDPEVFLGDSVATIRGRSGFD